MKKKISLLLLLCVLVLTFLCACDPEIAKGSVKSLTKPYITTYECVEARLGNQNLLEKYDFIKITLLDKDELEVSFKPKKGEKKSFKGAYSVDPETREFSGEIGIFGMTFKEKTTIEKGRFTIYKNILTIPLIMKFEAV